MDNNLKIYDIHAVYEGSMARGEIDNSHKKRYSDAFVYFCSGATDYSFVGKSFTAREGSVIFLPKGSSYFMNVLSESEYIVVDFEFEASPAVRAADCFHTPPVAIRSDFERLFHIWHKTEPYRDSEAFSELYRIYASCLRSRLREYAKSGEIYSAAVGYVLENYSSDTLTVGKIAESVGVSETHLRRIFSARAAISPVRYVNYLRIEKAKNMLLESNYTVGDVARLSGFSDSYYFSREFKKHTGLSPSEFRRSGESNTF